MNKDLSQTPINFTHKTREHNPKDLPSRIRKKPNYWEPERRSIHMKNLAAAKLLLSQHKNKYLQLTMKPKLRAAAGMVFAALLLSISTHLRAQDCLSGLPESIKSTIEQDNWKIVQPGDIPMDDWKLWKNTHQGQCPGVACSATSSPKQTHPSSSLSSRAIKKPSSNKCSLSL